MKLFKFFVNPSADNPTAGFRGVVALVVTASLALVLDWPSDLLVLVVVVFGGLMTSLALFSEAAGNLDK